MNNQVFGVFSCMDPTCQEYTLEKLFFNKEDADTLAQEIGKETITFRDKIVPMYAVEVRELSIH